MKNFQNYHLLLFIFSLLAKLGMNANILITVIGVASSQHLVMNRLADSMGERGHNVTVLNAIFSPSVKSIPLKYGKEISYRVVSDVSFWKSLQIILAFMYSLFLGSFYIISYLRQ